MTAATVSHASPFLLQKMNNLCSVLLREKMEFEQVATAITDKDLRSTLLTIAQESNQYACELSSQIHTLGGVPETVNNISESSIGAYSTDLNDESEIITFCKVNEKKMVGAYQEILNESSLFEGLRKMIRYQLNEMLCAFMHVKQLNALKLH